MRRRPAALLPWALLIGLAGPASGQVTLRLGTTAPEGSPWADACDLTRRVIEKNSRGTVRVKLFLSGMLGDEGQLVQQLTARKLDIFAGSGAAVHDVFPEMSVLELPFLFHDFAEVFQVLEHVRPLLEKAAESRGYRLLALGNVGFRHLGTKHPVASLAELRRLRLRSQPSPLHAQLWTRLGVHHRPIGLPQVVRSLEAGEVDAFDSAPVWMFASAWHQHIKTFTLTHHMYQAALVLMGPAGLERMGKAGRGMDEGLIELSREHIRRVDEVERALLAQLPDMGVEVRPVSPALRDEMRRLAAPIVAEWRKTASPSNKKLLESIETELRRLRAR